MQSTERYQNTTAEGTASQLGQQPNPKPGRKRLRYTSHACTVCQRRKIKCNGENPCSTCKTSGSRCQYTESLQRGRPKGSRMIKKGVTTTAQKHDDIPVGRVTVTAESDVSIRLRQLEEEIRSIRQRQRDAENLQAPIRHVSRDSSSVSTPAEVLAGSLVGVGSVERSSTGGGDLQPDMDPSTIYVAPRDNSTAKSLQDTLPEPNQCAGVENIDPLLEMLNSPKEGRGQKRRHGLDTAQESDQALDHLFCLLRFTTDLDDNIQYFIREFGYWFPCLEMDDIRPRLRSLSQQSSSSLVEPQEGILTSDPYDEPHTLSLVALICIIMAISEFLKQDGYTATLDENEKKGSPRWPTHEDWYAESCKLSARCRALQEMDALRQSLLSAIYQMMLEHLNESSQAIARAVDIAFALDLNNESHWVGFTDADRFNRRALWWTLYLFDRRVARKIGRPYYIHDQDALVGDFSGKIPDARAHAFDLGPLSPPEKDILGQKQSFAQDRSWRSYLQFHVEWSRISTKVWDTLYAVRAPHIGDENHIESLDALVVRLKRNLTPDLIWNTSFLGSKACDQAWDHKLRLQLVIFTRINLLRMWIRRHSSVHSQDDDDGHNGGGDMAHNANICQDLASETVDAVVRYMQFRKYRRPFATFATASLAECLYHLLSLPSETLNFEELQRVLRKARECLHRMALAGLQVAQNALNLLQDMLATQNNEKSSSPPSGAIIHQQQQQTQQQMSMLGWLDEFPAAVSYFRQEKQTPHQDSTADLFGNVDLSGETAASDSFTLWDASTSLDDPIWGLDGGHIVDQAWPNSHGLDGAFGGQIGV